MRYVVGVDGSIASRTALRWAIDEARHHGAHVDAVFAFPYATPALVGLPEAMYLPAMSYDVAKKEAESTLDGIVDGALQGEDHGITIDRIVVQGGAARVLLSMADGADLLVVGSRGLGGFKGMLLGSVSRHCVTHAPCPVLVVPAPDGS